MFPAILMVLLAGAGGGETPRRLPLPPELVSVEGVPPERVRLSVSVLDEAGRPVRGLGPSDFAVLEGGIRQNLIDFGVESDRLDRPLSAVFLVDRSGSVARQMGKWRQACVALALSMRPIDEVRVATFTSDVTVLRDFTGDARALQDSLEGLEESGGGTRIFRAVDETLRDLRRRPGRKVIFLMTDGLDNDRPGAWNTASDDWLTDLVRRAVESQVTVVTIMPGPTGRPALAAQDLAVQTGGWWLYTSDDLPGLVKRLGERLMASYFLAYDSTRSVDDPRRRRIEVSIHRAGMEALVVRTVEGVFAPRPVLRILEEDLEDEDEGRRALAASDLGLVADPGGTSLLLKALKDGSPGVRAAAVESLARRGDGKTAARIARLLEDEDSAVRDAAARALEVLAR
ncbi:MAG TPA: VWA domain-containing protein [Candidatus Polarisedimenticolia bacterium]